MDKYENEGTIDDYKEKLQLPKNLAKKPIKEGEEKNDPSKQIPEELWERIDKVQEIGGPGALNNIM